MITPEQGAAIVKKLAPNHNQKIVNRLFEKKIVNAKGKPHQASMISMVLSGERSNDDIENVILEMVREADAKEEERNALLNIEKKMPGATTPGI